MRSLPSVYHKDADEWRLLPFNSKTGRLCKDNCCNRCCDPCSEGVVSDFAPFGSAMTSYFKLLKGFYTLFFIMACLAIPAVVINTFGAVAIGAQQTQVLAIAVTTLGNLPTAAALANATSPSFTLPYTGVSMDVTEAAAIYAGLDFCAVVCFLLFYAGVRLGLVEEDEQVNKVALGPEHFSVFLPDINGFFPKVGDETDDALRVRAEAALRDWAKRVSKSKRRPEGYEVADVNVVDDNMGLLRIYEQRGTLFRADARLDFDIGVVKQLIGDRPQRCWLVCDRQYARLRALEAAKELLEERIAKFTAEAKDFKSRGPTAAFVTFESMAGALVVLGKFPESAMAYYCMRKKLRLLERRVLVREAPKVESVLWANLNIKTLGRAVRQSLTGIIAAALILLSFLFIVYASLTNSSVQASIAPADCTSPDLMNQYANGTWTNVTIITQNVPSTDTVYKCFCQTQIKWGSMPDFDTIYNNPWAPRCESQSCFAMLAQSVSRTVGTSYCYTFLQQRAYAVGLTVGATVSIALVNILLSSCMRAMSVFEGHSSSDDLDKALVVRLFFAQFMNTALLQIIINAAWDTITGEHLPIPGTGAFDDFNGGWYKSVGANFHTTMITLAITPHIGVLMALWGMQGKVNDALEQVRRQKELSGEQPKGSTAVDVPQGYARKPRGPPPPPKPVPPQFKTQHDLNETFLAPPVDYVLRYVVVLNVIFVCFVFSAGMPLLMPIAAASLFISFNVDKLAFLYLAPRQPAAANSVARYVVSLLPLAILLHLGVGVWMLGSVTVFKNALLDQLGLTADVQMLLAAGATVSTRTGILKTGVLRLTTPQTLPLVVLFAGVLAGLVLQFVITVLGSLAWTLLDLLLCGNLARLPCCKFCAKDIEDVGEDEPDVEKLPRKWAYSAASRSPFYGTKLGITGVRSFNCLENPTLQRMFTIPPDYWETNKGLASVANFGAEDALAAAKAENFLRKQQVAASLRRNALLAFGRLGDQDATFPVSAATLKKVARVPRDDSPRREDRVLAYAMRFMRLLHGHARAKIAERRGRGEAAPPPRVGASARAAADDAAAGFVVANPLHAADGGGEGEHAEQDHHIKTVWGLLSHIERRKMGQ